MPASAARRNADASRVELSRAAARNAKGQPRFTSKYGFATLLDLPPWGCSEGCSGWAWRADPSATSARSNAALPLSGFGRHRAATADALAWPTLSPSDSQAAASACARPTSDMPKTKPQRAATKERNVNSHGLGRCVNSAA